MTEFTAKDAQNLVAVAEAAPLANMAAAKDVSLLCGRFARFYDIAMEAIKFKADAEAPKPAADQPPAPPAEAHDNPKD